MFNRIQLHGYMGNDPEYKVIDGNNGPFARVSFRVGVPRDFGDETDWFFCTMTGDIDSRPDVINKYFRKGSEIFLEGRLESFRARNEEKQTYWTVKVSDFNFCGKKSNRQNVENEAPEGFTEVDEDFRLF